MERKRGFTLMVEIEGWAATRYEHELNIAEAMDVIREALKHNAFDVLGVQESPSA